MSEASELEQVCVQLSKKIDNQARFTRGVTVICTLSVLGVVFYATTQIVSTLPTVTLLHFMSNMDQIDREWRFVHAVNSTLKPTLPKDKGPAASEGTAANESTSAKGAGTTK